MILCMAMGAWKLYSFPAVGGERGMRSYSLKYKSKRRWVILVNMVMSVILGHEKTKIQNILDLGKIDIFSDRTNIYIKNKKMGHLI